MHVRTLKNLAYLIYDKDYYACKHVLSKKFKMFCNSMMNYLNVSTAIYCFTRHNFTYLFHTKTYVIVVHISDIFFLNVIVLLVTSETLRKERKNFQWAIAWKLSSLGKGWKMNWLIRYIDIENWYLSLDNHVLTYVCRCRVDKLVRLFFSLWLYLER